MPLTEMAIRSAKPAAKPYKLADAGGLYLLVNPTGSRLWRLKYRIGGREKVLAIGAYPDIPLAKARDRRTEARRQLANGIDPSAFKKEARQKAKAAVTNTFRSIAEEHLAKLGREGLADITLNKRRWLLGFAYPALGERDVATITAKELLEVLRAVEETGRHETARRMRAALGAVFRYAIATARAENDPTFALRDALTTPQVTHRAAVTTPKEFGALLRAIDGYTGQPASTAALRLLPLLFPRPGELRLATWPEFDLDKGIWSIPSERMKMRRPHRVPLPAQAVAKTGVPALDECHVITHHARTGDVVEAIKDGLERDGLGDLVLSVTSAEANGTTAIRRTVNRRPDFVSTEIFLPKVLLVENGAARDLDYDTDILAAIDWRGYDPQAIADRIPENAQAAESQLQRIELTDTQDHFATRTVAAGLEALRFDAAHAVRMILDLVPNPFVGRDIVGRTLNALRARAFDDAKLGTLSTLIVEELRRGLEEERTRRAEALFKDAVAAGRIQFRLRLDGNNWRMPFTVDTTEPEGADQIHSANGGPLERSLFLPIYKSELNDAERDVAVYLDGNKALVWWHRNVARSQYGLQGWRRARIYPDFIFAARRDGASNRLVVLETKGEQLDNLDTAYKREVLKVMSDHFAWDTTVPAGTLQLVSSGETVECTLILMNDVRTTLPRYLSS